MPALVLDSSAYMKIIMKQGSISFHHYKANKDHPLSINKKQRQFLQLIVRLFTNICLCDKTYFLKFSGRCTLCKQGIHSNMCCSHLPSTTCNKSWSGSCLDTTCTCAQKTSICVYMACRKCFCRSQISSSLFCCKMPRESFFG